MGSQPFSFPKRDADPMHTHEYEYEVLRLLFKQGDDPLLFQGSPLQRGNGLNKKNGFMLPSALQECFGEGAKSYKDLWGREGPVSRRAQAGLAAAEGGLDVCGRLLHALAFLVEQHLRRWRQVNRDAKNHNSSTRKHSIDRDMLALIGETIDVLSGLLSDTWRGKAQWTDEEALEKSGLAHCPNGCGFKFPSTVRALCGHSSICPQCYIAMLTRWFADRKKMAKLTRPCPECRSNNYLAVEVGMHVAAQPGNASFRLPPIGKVDAGMTQLEAMPTSTPEEKEMKAEKETHLREWNSRLRKGRELCLAEQFTEAGILFAACGEDAGQGREGAAMRAVALVHDAYVARLLGRGDGDEDLGRACDLFRECGLERACAVTEATLGRAQLERALKGPRSEREGLLRLARASFLRSFKRMEGVGYRKGQINACAQLAEVHFTLAGELGDSPAEEHCRELPLEQLKEIMLAKEWTEKQRDLQRELGARALH